MTVSAPAACASRVIAAMSAIFVTGLVGLSKSTRRVGFDASTRSMPGEILDGQHGVGDAEAPQQAPYQIARGVVGLDKAQDVIALLREREQRLRDRPPPRWP